MFRFTNILKFQSNSTLENVWQIIRVIITFQIKNQCTLYFTIKGIWNFSKVKWLPTEYQSRNNIKNGSKQYVHWMHKLHWVFVHWYHQTKCSRIWENISASSFTNIWNKAKYFRKFSKNCCGTIYLFESLSRYKNELLHDKNFYVNQTQGEQSFYSGSDPSDHLVIILFVCESTPISPNVRSSVSKSVSQ